MIKATGLCKTYKNKYGVVNAVNGVDLSVKRGDFIAIVGDSGSGKSTLVNLLGLLDRPDSGSYIFNGTDTFRLSEKRLSLLRSRDIGFIFQNYSLVPHMTALENVELGLVFRGIPPSQRRKLAEAALEKVGLASRKHHKPGEMSGGQQQRTAIARAIVGDPILLLADEPTGNLDCVSSAQIISILKELNLGGATVLLITHDANIAAAANRILTVRDGKLL